MAINMTFVDFQTVVPADWLNNVNTVVNQISGVFTPASIAALRATTNVGFTIATVQGYYGADDHGGGTYIYNPTDVSSSDNGGTVIVDGIGRRWHLQYLNSVSLRQFGAKGDGVTDDTASLQNAVNWCAASGFKLTVPTATVSYMLTNTINITGGFIMEGDGVVPYTNQSSTVTNTRGLGSWFYFNHANKGFNIFNATPFNRMVFNSIGTYRNQPTPNGAASFTPTIADWDFYINNSGCEIHNTCLLNPYNGIYATLGACQVVIDNVFGQPLHYGIQLDNCFDVVRANNVHWWPFWSGASGVYTWTKANAIGLYTTRCDNPLFSNWFSIYMQGWLISGNVNGSLNNAQSTNMGFDGTSNGITVDNNSVNAVCRFSNFYTQGDTGGVNNFGFITSGTGGEFDFSNANFTNYADNAVRLQGTGTTVRFGAGVTISVYNTSGGGFAGVDVETGNNLVSFSVIPLISGGGSAPIFFNTGSGTINCPLTKGFVSATTNGSGQLVVAHGAGISPNNVIVSVFGTSTPLFALVSGFNGTSFTVTFFNTSGSTVSGVGVAFNWKCEF